MVIYKIKFKKSKNKMMVKANNLTINLIKNKLLKILDKASINYKNLANNYKK